MANPIAVEEMPELDLDKATDRAIAACDGDLRATIKTLIATNDLLWKQIRISTAYISSGYARGLYLSD